MRVCLSEKALYLKLQQLIVRVHSVKSHFIEYLQPQAISCFDHGSHEMVYKTLNTNKNNNLEAGEAPLSTNFYVTT